MRNANLWHSQHQTHEAHGMRNANLWHSQHQTHEAHGMRNANLWHSQHQTHEAHGMRNASADLDRSQQAGERGVESHLQRCGWEGQAANSHVSWPQGSRISS
jgi:hypothetical protein